MKKLFTLPLLLVTLTAFSQEKVTADTGSITTRKTIAETGNEAAQPSDRIPSFPGGDYKLYEFVATNLEYPAAARRDKIQGRVVMRFIVTETGKLDSVTVVKGIRQDLDNAAIQLVRKMPDWIPGTKNGVPARIWCVLPVSFRYQ